MRERENVRANGGRSSCNEIQPHWIHGVVSGVERPSLLKFLRQCKTLSQCVSLAPPREPLKLSLLHSVVFHIALRRGETHPACLSCSAESATEAISLTLFCTERVFHIALSRTCHSEGAGLRGG